MQKFILIRGHQGSGKSTFAEQKAAEFKAQYPDAEVVRIENDVFITDEYGEYRWSGEAVDKAQKRGNALMTETLRLGRQNPNRNILIINSNTNQKASRCRHLLDQAEKSSFETEVYRLHNFYPNLHGVKELLHLFLSNVEIVNGFLNRVTVAGKAKARHIVQHIAGEEILVARLLFYLYRHFLCHNHLN